jgi:hypothetical protein
VLETGQISGALVLQSIPKDAEFQAIGDLKKGTYGFAALLRKDDCTVLGYGCTPVNLEQHRHVTIEVDPSPPLGTCKVDQGERCVAGFCQGGGRDGGVIVGEADVAPDTNKPTCTLQVLAAMDLEVPLVSTPTLSGPAVVVTPSGFVIAYREANGSSANSAKGIRQPVDDSGAKGPRVPFDLASCPGDPSSNGVSATWNDTWGAGLMAVATPICGDAGAKAQMSNFDDKGVTIAEYTYPPLSTAERFVSGHGAAPFPAVGAPADNKFFVGSVHDSEPVLFWIEGLTIDQQTRTNVPFPGASPSFVQVATTSSVIAALTDSKADGGALMFSVMPPGGAFNSVTLPASSATAVSAWKDRAVLVYAASQGIKWSVRTAAGEQGPSDTIAGGPFTAVDAVTLNDHLLIFAAQKGSITAYRLDGIVSGTPGADAAAMPQVTFSSTVGATSLAQFEGTAMGVAAARNRVIVAWLNTLGQLGANKPPGGYAVLSCDG